MARCGEAGVGGGAQERDKKGHAGEAEQGGEEDQEGGVFGLAAHRGGRFSLRNREGGKHPTAFNFNS
jgi:hypothetical protein